MLVELSRSTGSNLFNVNYLKGHNEFAIHVGWEERLVRLYEETYGAINPHFAPLQSVPVGKVVTSAMLVDQRELHGSKFYREFLKPAGIRDSIGFNVLKTNYRLGVLVCFRSESQGDYKEADVGLLSSLAPHICRSMAISDALNLKAIRSEALEATLNALASGVYLADCDGRIIYMNPTAERQVEKGDAVRIENNRLRPSTAWHVPRLPEVSAMR
jgi:PAS domain-containing protein